LWQPEQLQAVTKVTVNLLEIGWADVLSQVPQLHEPEHPPQGFIV
jgi:hypothetical protein